MDHDQPHDSDKADITGKTDTGDQASSSTEVTRLSGMLGAIAQSVTSTEIEAEELRKVSGLERFFEPLVPTLTERSSHEEISKYCNFIHQTYSENITFARVGLRMLNEIIPGIRNSNLSQKERSEKIASIKQLYRDEINYFMFVNDYPNTTLLTIPYHIILKHHDKFRDVLDFYRTKFWTFNLGHNLTPKAKNKAYGKSPQ